MSRLVSRTKVSSVSIVAVVLAACLSACATGSTLPQIPMAGRPFGIAALPDGGAVFVALDGAAPGERALAVLPRQKGSYAVGRVLPVDGRPSGVALSHNGRTLAVAAGDRVLLLGVRDLLAGDAGRKREVPGLAGAIEVAFSPDDRLLAVSEEDAARITVIGLGREPGARIPVAVAPVGLVFSPDGRWLYATSEREEGQSGVCGGRPPGVVSAVSVTDRVVQARASVGCAPVRILLSNDGSEAFVALRGEDTVAAVSAAVLREGRAVRQSSIPVGRNPVGLALSPDRKWLLVANSARFAPGVAGTLSCVAVDGGGRLRLVSEAPSGDFPREVTALPGAEGFLVGLFRGEAVQVAAACPGAAGSKNGS